MPTSLESLLSTSIRGIRQRNLEAEFFFVLIKDTRCISVFDEYSSFSGRLSIYGYLKLDNFLHSDAHNSSIFAIFREIISTGINAK